MKKSLRFAGFEIDFTLKDRWNVEVDSTITALMEIDYATENGIDEKVFADKVETMDVDLDTLGSAIHFGIAEGLLRPTA